MELAWDIIILLCVMTFTMLVSFLDYFTVIFKVIFDKGFS